MDISQPSISPNFSKSSSQSNLTSLASSSNAATSTDDKTTTIATNALIQQQQSLTAGQFASLAPPNVIGAMGNPYTSPFHPNFLNPSFLQQAAASQAASMHGISKGTTPVTSSFGASATGKVLFFDFTGLLTLSFFFKNLVQNILKNNLKFLILILCYL